MEDNDSLSAPTGTGEPNIGQEPAENDQISSNEDDTKEGSILTSNETVVDEKNNGEEAETSDSIESISDDKKDESCLNTNETRGDNNNSGEVSAKSEQIGDKKEGEGALSDHTTGEPNNGQGPAENDQSSSNGDEKNEGSSLSSNKTVADEKNNGEDAEKSDSNGSNRDEIKSGSTFLPPQASATTITQQPVSRIPSKVDESLNDTPPSVANSSPGINDEPQNIEVHIFEENPFSFKVTWSSPKYRQPEYYEVNIYDGGKVLLCETVSSLSFTYSKCEVDKTYGCMVSTIREGGYKGKSATINFTTYGSLTKPTHLSAAQDELYPSTFTITWNAPLVLPEQYEVVVANGIDPSEKQTTKYLKIKFEDLKLDSEYNFTVTSLYKDDKKGKAEASTFKTVKGEVAQPQNIVAKFLDIGSPRIHVTWYPSAFAAKKYKVELLRSNVDSASIDELETETCEANFYRLSPDEVYFCRVTSMYGSTSFARATSTCIKTPFEGQVTPTDIKASLDDNNPYDLILTWSPSFFPPKLYEVILLEQRESSGVPINQMYSEECKAIFRNLQPDTEYSCLVSCKFASHQTSPVITKSVKTPHVNMQCTFRGHDRVECSWNGSRQKYTVELKLNGTVNNPIVVDVPRWSFNYADLQLKIGSMFKIMVSSENHFKTEFETLCIGEDTCVKNIEARRDTEDPFAVIVTWDEPRTKPDEYEVKAIGRGNSIDGGTTVSVCKATITGLKLETKYSIEVTPLLNKSRGMSRVLENILSTEKKCTSPIKVHAKPCDNNPFRTIITWEEPQIAPQNYEVKIQIENENVTKDDSKLTHVTQGLEESFFDIPMEGKCQCRVTSIYSSGRRGDSEIVSFQTPSIEDTTPKSVEIEPDRNDPFELHVSWKPPSLPTLKYKVLLFAEGNTTALDQKNTENCHWIFTSLRPNTIYFCCVQSLYSEDWGSEMRKSNLVETTDSQLSFRTLEDQVECSWAGANGKKYLVKLNIDGKTHPVETEKVKITLSFIKYAIEMGKELEMKVSRQNVNIGSAKFIVGSDTKPENLQVQLTEIPTKIKASWAAPPCKASRYKATISEDGGKYTNSMEVAKTKVSFRSLKMNACYTIKLRSLLGAMEGIPIATKVETTNDGDTRPKNALVLPSKVDPFKMRVSWKHSALKPLKYKVEKVEGAHLLKNHEVTTRNLEAIFSISELGDAYQFKITPIYHDDTKGSPATTEILNTATDKIFKSTLPRDVEIKGSAQRPFSVFVNWRDPEARGCESYVIDVIENGMSVRTYKLSDNKREISDLKQSSSYVFAVTSIYKKGARGLTAKSTEHKTISEKEAAPKNIKVIANSKNPFEMTVTWQPMPVQPKHYELTLISDKGASKKMDVTLETFTFTYTKLTPDTKYSVKIIAVFSDGTKSLPAHSNKATTMSRTVLAPMNIGYVASGRKVTVKWQKPESSLKLLKFSCKTYENGSIFESSELTAEECQVSFGVRNRHTYRCQVHAKYENGVEEHSEVNEISINTKRDTDYDVKVSGRPKHIQTKQLAENGMLVCKVSWHNPDLGAENHNFTRLKTTTTLFEKQRPNMMKMSYWTGVKYTWTTVETTEFCNSRSNEHTFKNLNFDDYKIVITYTYQDLDSRKSLDSTASVEFSTGVETPKNICVLAEGEKLTMTWDKAMGATQYKVSITNPVNKQPYIDPVIQNHTTFTTNMTRSCRYGQRCIFKVAGVRDDIRSEPAEMEILIGEKRVATAVELMVADEDPRRQLRVSWKHPEEVPDGYQVTLKSHDDKVVKMLCKKKEDTCHTFSELQPEQLYYCEILPKYKNTIRSTGSTWTKIVKTLKRVLSKYEMSPTFGHPSDIDHKLEETETSCVADLTWRELQSTQNFVFKGYQVQLDSDMENKIIFWSQKTPHLHVGLNYGLKYTLEVTSIFLDRDSSQQRRLSSSREFFTKPQKPQIERCTWKEGILTFRWTKQRGAKYYALHVKDKNLENDIILEKNLSKNAYDTEMKGNLRMGKSCMIKVSSIGEDNQTSSTEFLHQRIGDEDVPRNVMAMMNRHPSGRRVDIKLDQPICEAKPKSYRVVAIPERGRYKVSEFKFEEFIVFKDLRKGVKYHFEVHADYVGGKKSNGGCTNDIQIPRDTTHGAPTMTFSDMKEAKISIGHVEAPREANTISEHPTGNLAQATHLEATPKDSDAERTACDIKWSPPRFEAKQYDYKIYRYNIKIVRQDGTVLKESKEEFKEGASKYEVRAVSLRNGFSYDVEITTEYEVIDMDTDYISDPARISVTTKPGPTVFISNKWSDGNLVLKWTRSVGANAYRVDILDDKGETLHQSDKIQDRGYKWKPERSTFGSRYKVKVFLIGKDGKESHMESDHATLGGDRVPKFVNAENAKESEKWKQAWVTWKEPTTIAHLKHYNVVAIEEDTNNSNEAYETVNTECVVGDLRAGTQYRFQVTATYEDGTTSYGSLSNTIKTDPKPSQVKGVIVERVQKHLTPAICVEWKKEDQISIHVVEISSEDLNYKRILKSQNMPLICDGLRYGHTYKVRARAGNDSGFGVWSEGEKITTVHGMPGSIFLDSTSLTSESAELRFTRAPETPSHYGIKIIRKQRGHGNEILEFDHKFPSGERGSEQQQIDSINCIYTPREENCGLKLTGLQPNTEYIVKLHAYYRGNRGDDVETALLTAPARAQKPTVNVVKIKDWYSSKDVVIELPGQDGCDCHQIRVLTGKDSTENQFILAGQRKTKYTCEHESAIYKFQARSKNASEKYGEWSEMTQIQLAPTALKNVKAVRSGSNILLSWDAPMQRVSKIYVQVKEGNEPLVVAAKATSHEYKPTAPSNAYNFSIFAVRSIPQSDDIPGEPIRTGEVISKPETPKTFGLTAEGTSLTISWGLSKYLSDRHDVRIIRSDMREAETRMHVDANETRCSCKDLCPGKRYEVMIRYVYKDVKGDWSNARFARLVPAKIDVTEFKIKELHVTLKWDPVEGKNIEYHVELFENDDKKAIDCYYGKDTQWESNKIKRGRTYNYKIAASNKSGIRLVSAKVDVTEFKIQELHVTLKWNPVEGENTKYHVELFENDGKEAIDCYNGKDTQWESNQIKCGKNYNCKIAASNKSGIGSFTKTDQIKSPWDRNVNWEVDFSTPDPSKIVKIKWEKPEGVNHFRIGIDHLPLFELGETEYMFCNGVAGHTHVFRLYCGYNENFDGEGITKSFTMHPAKPEKVEIKADANNPSAIFIAVTDLVPPPFKRRVVVFDNRDVEKSDTLFNIHPRQHKLRIENLDLGKEYYVGVASVDKNGAESSLQYSNSLMTYPAKPDKVKIKADANNPSAIFIAVTDQGPTPFKRRVVVFDNRDVEKSDTLFNIHPRQLKLRIENLDLGKEYYVGVASVDKNGAESSLQYSNSLMTSLSPPSNIRVTSDDVAPDTVINVAFDDTAGASMYKITAKPTSGIGGTVDIISKKNNTKLTGLIPGKSYKVSVSSMCGDDKNLQSEAAESEEFCTSLPEFSKPTATRLNNGDWKISWNKQTGADRYRVQWGIENQVKRTEPDTDVTERILRNTKPGKRYEVQIATVCNGTAQKSSETEKFTTAPKTPENLQYELISTEEVRLWCEPSDGADTYEFQIDSDDFVTLPLEATSKTEPLFNNREKKKVLTKDSPTCKISYPFEKINFSVTAKNEGGSSPPSILKHFRQVIRYVKQKFQKKAKDIISADDFAHVHLKEDSSTDNVDVNKPIVKPRETAMIYGPLFSGKSALCSYLIQSQSQQAVGILFDFFDLENNGNKMNFGGLLKTTMPDLTAEEVKTLVSWMIKNQEEVLFLIENVTVEKQFNPTIHDIDAQDVPKNLIYNLLKLDREILPRSKVICTTTQANLRTTIRPTKSLKLLGLSESGKTRMLKMHGNNNSIEELPPHLAIFLCNPGLSKAIMNLSRTRCDIFSKASVLIEAITQIFDRQTEAMKNASLAVMKQEIERLQKEENASFRLRKAGRTTTKLSGSAWEGSVYSPAGTGSFFEEPEATPASMDCMQLQELFFRAISIALLINCADFEKVLKKKPGLEMQNAASVKFAAGLLRGETMRKADRLFSPTLKVIVDSEAEKKGKALIKFISKNCEAIKTHVYDDSKLTLDWMECCVELGDGELWAKCSPQIKVKNSTTDEELRQLEDFLKNPLAASGKTTVSLKYNLSVTAKVGLETAIKDNPSGTAIIVYEYKKGTLTRKESHRILTNESQASHRAGHKPSEPETDADDSLCGNETLRSHDQDCFDKGSTITLKRNDFGEESTMQSGESQHKFETTSVEEHGKKDKDVSSTKETHVKASSVPDGIKVEWKKQDNAASYEVRLCIDGQRNVETMTSTKGLQHVFKSYSFGKKYFCTVTAMSEENEILGPSQKSNVVVKVEGK